MHFEASGSNEEARAAEVFVFPVIAQDVANVLAEKTFDTFAKFCTRSTSRQYIFH
jgi:hypothetical protein